MVPAGLVAGLERARADRRMGFVDGVVVETAVVESVVVVVGIVVESVVVVVVEIETVVVESVAVVVVGKGMAGRLVAALALALALAGAVGRIEGKRIGLGFVALGVVSAP